MGVTDALVAALRSRRDRQKPRVAPPADPYLQLYEAEHEANEYLRLTQQMKDELVATVSHELRTPLTCILGFAHTLHEHGEAIDAAARRDFVARIISQAERLHRLVESFLLASRVTEPDLDAAADVGTEIASAVRDLVDVHQCAVETAVDPLDLRAAIAPAALYQIVFNLAENAVKFSHDDSRPQVLAFRDGDVAVIEVTNRGGVIAMDDQVRIFEPFVQLDGSTTREVNGVGLGLAIVRRLVETYRGQVGVRSSGGETIFWVRLPDADRPAAVEARGRARRWTPSAAPG